MDMHAFDRPLLSMGVHLNSDAGTRSERSQKQFVRLRARIIAAVRTWFVRLERVRADGYVLDERHRSRIDKHVPGHISSQHLPVCAAQETICTPGSNLRERLVPLIGGNGKVKAGFRKVIFEVRVGITVIAPAVEQLRFPPIPARAGTLATSRSCHLKWPTSSFQIAV